MPVNKQHDEFYAVDLDSGWETPPGYPQGIQQKILAGALDEERKQRHPHAAAAVRARASSPPRRSSTSTGRRSTSSPATSPSATTPTGNGGESFCAAHLRVPARRARRTARSNPRQAACCSRSTTSIPCEAGARATRRRPRERTHDVGASWSRSAWSASPTRAARARAPSSSSTRSAPARPRVRWTACARPAPSRRRMPGIPISVKDLFDVRGQVTRAGSRVLAERARAERDATAVARLRRAGLVLIGRTTMTEFAYSGLGLNPHYGTPANPWERERRRIPGGSSSGAAVSVADGMAHGALGTDTGGSCRIPAALCGLVGFKPTQARVPAGRRRAALADARHGRRPRPDRRLLRGARRADPERRAGAAASVGAAAAAGRPAELPPRRRSTTLSLPRSTVP